MGAPTVLLLHGVQSSARTWWRVAADLEELGWSVQAHDLLGHGGRPAGGALSIDVLAGDVRAHVAAPVDLVVGHSLGAIVALTALRDDPGLARAVVVEDPPGLAGDLDPGAVAADVEGAAQEARADPAGTVEALLAEHPWWSRTDAVNAVESRCDLDVTAVSAMVRTAEWDLQALSAGCPTSLRVLAATRDSALRGPDRAALARGDFVEVDSGHSIHRDRPALWLHHVTRG